MHFTTVFDISSPTRRLVSQAMMAYFGVALCTLLCLSAVNCNRVQFDLQELTHDSPVIDTKNQVQLNGPVGEQLQYNLNSIKSNLTIRLFLAKPFKLREIETEINKPLVEINDNINEINRLPYIKFANLNAYHRGNYSLYIFLYDLDGHLVKYSRIDFHLVVEGKN